jgi:hypothetical protein
VARGVCADNVLTLRRELEAEKRRAPALVTPARVSPDSAVQLIVFDLDGVLVETRDLHYHALNRALAEVCAAPRHAVSLGMACGRAAVRRRGRTEGGAEPPRLAS